MNVISRSGLALRLEYKGIYVYLINMDDKIKYIKDRHQSIIIKITNRGFIIYV